MPPVKKYAVSPDICASKLILFLGAGASASLGLPLMDSFMDVLEAGMDRKSLATVQAIYTMPGKSRDLEVVFDTFRDYDKIAHYFRYDPNLSRTPAGLDSLMARVDRIRGRAMELVLQQYSEVRTEELRRLYRDFVLLLAESNKHQHLPIFTTNYDLAIETLAEDSAADSFGGFELVDGFTRDNVRRWDPSLFDRFGETSEGEATILLFKLHGSCQWRVRKHTEEVTKESTPQLEGKESTYDNGVMWPGETKRIKKGPHETNYNYLEQCLMQAEACVVVGFSFRDPVIKGYFVKALDLNEKLKVALVDPHAEPLAQELLGGKLNGEALEQDVLGVEPTTTMPAPEETIVVRRSDGTVIHGIPTHFEPDELPHIVKALLRIGFPLDSERVAGLFT
jgi:NAD-dependent SIR2 family protein deacetylase